MTPRRISQPNSVQPRQKANTDSSVAATTIIATSTRAARVASNATAATSAATLSVAPMPCANRFGGPGTHRGATGSLGVMTRVTSWPSGLSVGPVSTRATNP